MESVRKTKVIIAGGATVLLLFSGIAISIKGGATPKDDYYSAKNNYSTTVTTNNLAKVTTAHTTIKACETPTVETTYPIRFEIKMLDKEDNDSTGTTTTKSSENAQKPKTEKAKTTTKTLTVTEDSALIPIISDNDEICYTKIEPEEIVPEEVVPEEVIPEETVSEEIVTEDYTPYTWDGPVLNSFSGMVYGPSGTETYYNLDMTGVISIMESCGYYYDYWVREDGVKMYGDYVMVAADLNIRPRGSIVPTSLGLGIVCDTGGFVGWNSTNLDIATTW